MMWYHRRLTPGISCEAHEVDEASSASSRCSTASTDLPRNHFDLQRGVVELSIGRRMIRVPQPLDVPTHSSVPCSCCQSSRLTDRVKAAGDTPAGARQLDARPCPPRHDTTASLRTRAPASFKRLLGGLPDQSGICEPDATNQATLDL